MKEIYKDEEYKDLQLEGINELANTVLLTMGPNGSTVTITDEYGNTYITKDGVSVANKIVFKDTIKNTGAELIKQVAQKTVEEAGDGTTTSICLAQAFINKGYELMKEGYTFNQIRDNLDILELEVVHQLKKNSRKCTKKDIINVATIAANNDIEIGKMISDAYKNSNVVKVEEVEEEFDTLDKVNGMQLEGSYFHKAFINNPKKESIEYNNCKFIIYDGKIENITDISNHLEGVQDRPIIIMADHFNDSVVSLLKQNYNEGNIAIGLLKSPNFAEHRRNIVQDIISYTKAFHSMKSKVYITNLDSVFADRNKIIITKKDADGSGRAAYLKAALKVQTDKSSKKLLQDRINLLEGNLSIIKVGGKSELERRERKDRIDDAVLAVKCALEEGIIEGGGVALAKIYLYNNYTKSPILELLKCLITPYDYIFRNNKPIDPIRKDMFKENILDPFKVTRCALQNALSVTKTILSSEAIVINDRLWN